MIVLRAVNDVRAACAPSFRASLTGSRPRLGRLVLRAPLCSAKRIIGLYGGSFDPPHGGHVHVAQMAQTYLGLDEVWWLVSPQNPLKPQVGSLSERISAIGQLLAHRSTRMRIVNFEARARLQFTADTVCALQRRFSGVHFVLILGADSFANMHLWRRWREIVATLPIAVIARPGQTFRALRSPAAQYAHQARVPSHAALRLGTKPPPAWLYLPTAYVALSSTLLRASAAQAQTSMDLSA